MSDHEMSLYVVFMMNSGVVLHSRYRLTKS